MRETPITSSSPEARPERRAAGARRGDATRVEPQPRHRYDHAQRDARRQRALVSAWLRTLSRAR